jgi:hypothetical protein
MFAKVLSKEEDTAAIAILDGQNRVVSWAYGGSDNLEDIKRYMRVSGGNNVIIITNSGSLFSKYSKMSLSASLTKDDIFLDVIHTDRNTGEIIQNLKEPKGKWQLYEPKESRFLIKNISIQKELGFNNSLSNHPILDRRRYYFTKENIMSDEQEVETNAVEEEKRLSPEELAFRDAIYQRRIVSEALRNGTLSCLPGEDGFADTKPVINIMDGNHYKGANLLFLKEHQKQNGCRTAEYISSSQMDMAHKDNPELFILKGKKGVSLHWSEHNDETGEWEPKHVRLFNISQTSKPGELKKWAEQYHVEYPKAGPLITCTSTEPKEYLGQFFAAVSLGGQFKASKEQANDFAKKMGDSLFEKTDKISEITHQPVTDPFKLSKITNVANDYCKDFIKELKASPQKLDQEQKLENQQKHEHKKSFTR